MPVTIKTNNQWRDLVYRADVPAKVLESQFDYQDPDDCVDGYFEYRGQWYHLDMFMPCTGSEELKAWSGYHGDSYFSGVLIKVCNDTERVICATYFS